MRSSEQAENIERVKNRIGGLIVQFFSECIAAGQFEFHADELREYIGHRIVVAPGSPDRILRQLRREGKLGYKVVSRRGSLYRIGA